jgi:hypothetical protein
MKMYVLGSNAFLHEMISITKQLIQLGYDGWIHPDYIKLDNGELPEQIEAWKYDRDKVVEYKKDYIHSHYKHILESDAILCVNYSKGNICNYIGGNVLIEMGQAYVNYKKIYFLNDMPTELPYLDEIKAMKPICLYGDLRNIG